METQQPLCGCAITPCNHDVEWKEQMADVGQALVASAVIDIVQDQDVERSQIGLPGCGHASGHPA